MNIFASVGAAVGLAIGLIISVILLKFANTNHKFRTEYDERQKEIRGRCYQYGFWAMAVYECIMTLLGIGEIPVPMSPFVIHFAAILIGVLVLGGYSIWNGVYWGMNNDRKRYAAVFIAAGILNLIPVVRAVHAHTLLEDGKLGAPAVNLLALIAFLTLGVLMLIRSAADRGLQEE